jgi:probable F420-dependent oxidoreductase
MSPVQGGAGRRLLVDGQIGTDLGAVAESARHAEAEGWDGVWSAEVAHDPFLPLAIAAEHTSRVQLGTAITVAFARNPMTAAVTSWDLNTFSRGRLILGLGSQIKPHIEKRFSMTWSHPAPRMKEFVSALHAIWAAWQDGTKLNFRGEFYTHTLTTPFFTPAPSDYGIPRVFIAAVGEGMTRVAGEVADGMLVHGFTTARYIHEVTLPAVEAGLAASGRTRQDFELSYPIMIATGATEEERAASETSTREQIAFYGSTPAYRGVLEAHGWGDLQGELNILSKEGRWVEMGKLIDDDILDAFAIVGPPEEVAALIVERTRGLVDRVSLYASRGLSHEVISQIRGDLLEQVSA